MSRYLEESLYSRRRFLGRILGATSFVAFSGTGLRHTLAQPTGGELGSTCTALPTRGDIEGPFYVPDAPFRAVLADPAEAGQRIVIRGLVMDPQCRALPGAVVDLWQADAAGHYDNERGTIPGHFHLRGQVVANGLGEYEVETILPGRYPLTTEQFRPAHVHYKVRMPGFAELTTQLYFAGDPSIAADPWASRAEATRIIELDEADGRAVGQFDIVLAA